MKSWRGTHGVVVWTAVRAVVREEEAGGNGKIENWQSGGRVVVVVVVVSLLLAGSRIAMNCTARRSNGTGVVQPWLLVSAGCG